MKQQRTYIPEPIEELGTLPPSELPSEGQKYMAGILGKETVGNTSNSTIWRYARRYGLALWVGGGWKLTIAGHRFVASHG